MKTTFTHTQAFKYGLFILCMVTVAFTGCKKDKDGSADIKSANLVGKWYGVKLVDDEDGGVEWAAPSAYLQFNANGAVSGIDFDGDDTGSCTWSLSGNTLTVVNNTYHETDQAQIVKLTGSELVMHSQEEGTTAYYKR